MKFFATPVCALLVVIFGFLSIGVFSFKKAPDVSELTVMYYDCYPEENKFTVKFKQIGYQQVKIVHKMLFISHITAEPL